MGGFLHAGQVLAVAAFRDGVAQALAEPRFGICSHGHSVVGATSRGLGLSTRLPHAMHQAQSVPSSSRFHEGASDLECEHSDIREVIRVSFL